MSLAADTRSAVRRRPFLFAALRAGVVNYTAAARFLSDELGDDGEAIATALGRFADELPEYRTDERAVRVAMESGLGETNSDATNQDATNSGEDALLSVGGKAFAPGSGSLTGVVVSGDVDATSLAHVLSRLELAGVEVVAASVAGESLVVVVERRDGANAVRVVEGALDAVPRFGEE